MFATELCTLLYPLVHSMPKRGRSPSPIETRSAKRLQSNSVAQVNSKPLLPTNGRKITSAVQKKLELATQSVPRYLFRAWQGSDDERVLESKKHIMPRSFEKYEAPQLMLDVPKKLLVTTTKAHLRFHPSPSLFSNWTHSLHAALEKAKELEARAAPDSEVTRLCILDTKRLPHNVVMLHTSQLGLLDKRIPKIPTVEHKFLAYSVVPGSAYRFIECQYHRKYTRSWPNVGSDEFEGLADEIELARKFGPTFGPAFELPVVATLLSMYRDRADVLTNAKWKEDLVSLLCAGYEVPADWQHDPAIMTDMACMAGYKDAMRGRVVMRAMVERKLGTTTGAATRNRGDSLACLANGVALSRIGDGEDDESDDGYAPEASSDSEGNTSDDVDPEEFAKPLLRSDMDDVTKRKLQQTRSHTPRYLFRGWRKTSGGYADLNTTTAITPLAYDKCWDCAKKSIFDHTSRSLFGMAIGHLKGRKNITTEFSSWGASLQVALYFTFNDSDAYISIIDTTKLAKRNRNVILHVPSLHFMTDRHGSHEMREDSYDWEYLAHGVIEGRGLSVVPLKAFRSIGVPRHFSRQSLRFANACSSRTFLPMSAAEVKMARKVADQYGRSFTVAVTLAILCLTQRCGDLWDCGNIKNLQVIADVLQDCHIPEHWCRDKSILTDVVYTKGYGELKQMIHLLRALVNYYHGKSARARSRPRARSGARPNAYARAESRERGRKRKGVRWRDQRYDAGDGVERRGRTRIRELTNVRLVL